MSRSWRSVGLRLAVVAAAALLLSGCGGPAVTPGNYVGASTNPPPTFQIIVNVDANGNVASVTETYQSCADAPHNVGYVFKSLPVGPDGSFSSGADVDGERVIGKFDGLGHITGTLTDLRGNDALPLGCRVRSAAWAASLSG